MTEVPSHPILYKDLYDHLEWFVFGKQWVVYQLIARNGRLLYVGMTGNIGTRIRAHRHAKQIPFFKARCTVCESKFEAMELEAAMIRTLQPPHNSKFAVTSFKRLDGSRVIFRHNPVVEYRIPIESEEN